MSSTPPPPTGPPDGPLTGPPSGSPNPAWGQGPSASGPQPPYSGPPPSYAGPQPPYGSPQPPDGSQQPPYGGEQPPLAQPGSPRRRGVTVLIVTTVLAVMVAGGAFAFYEADPLHLFRSGPQAAEALPGDALFYVGVDADPSAKQKIEALRFLNHFPAFRDNAGLDDENSDIRASVFSKIIDSANCDGVTYDDTVKPWLGNKFGLALMPATSKGSGPDAVIAMAVTDESKAKTGLSALASCGDQTVGKSFGYAFENDYVLFAETQVLADKYAEHASSGSLADNGDFTSDMDSIGDLGVATMWVDVAAAVDAYGDSSVGNGLSPTDLTALTSSYTRAAATFRFANDHVEMAASVFGDTPDISHHDNQIVHLPDTTVFAMSEAGGSERLKSSWDDIKSAMSSNGVDVDQELSDFESQTGLTLPDDLETVLGDNLMFALDSAGLSSATLQSSDPSQFDFGVRMTGDPTKLGDLYDQITTLMQDQSDEPLPLSRSDASDGLSIATNDAYAKTLAGLDGDLGSSPAFQSVIQDASSKEFVLFFDWDAIEDQVIENLPDDSSGATQQVIDNLKALRAVGMTSETDGNYTVTTLEVSVND